MHRQHQWFMPFENFSTLRDVGMVAEEELAREKPAKTSSGWTDNY